MGSYTTSAAMESWLGTEQLRQLSNLDQSAEDIDTDRVDGAITSAEAELNAALGVRYDLPLSSPYPSVVVDLTKQLTRWYLWDGQSQEPPLSITEGYKRIQEKLKLIRTGELDLGLTTAGSEAAVGDSPRARVRSGGSARRLTRDLMRGF